MKWHLKQYNTVAVAMVIRPLREPQIPPFLHGRTRSFPRSPHTCVNSKSVLAISVTYVRRHPPLVTSGSRNSGILCTFSRCDARYSSGHPATIYSFSWFDPQAHLSRSFHDFRCAFSYQVHLTPMPGLGRRVLANSQIPSGINKYVKVLPPAPRLFDLPPSFHLPENCPDVYPFVPGFRCSESPLQLDFQASSVGALCLPVYLATLCNHTRISVILHCPLIISAHS